MRRIIQSLIICITIPLLSCQTASEIETSTSAENSSQYVTKIDQDGVDKPAPNVSESKTTSAEGDGIKETKYVNANKNPDERICKEQVQTGTRFMKEVCKTRSEWKKERTASKSWLEDFTRRSSYGS